LAFLPLGALLPKLKLTVSLIVLIHLQVPGLLRLFKAAEKWSILLPPVVVAVVLVLLPFTAAVVVALED
jgi:hypothetical protein